MRKIKAFMGKVYRKIIALLNKPKISKSRKKLALMHNVHKGKRCFIVGNGPSLNVEDLDKLKNEICFGTHRIYNIFEKTSWRPNYYCAQDSKLILSSAKNIKKIDSQKKFIAIVEGMRYPTFHNAIYVKMNVESFYPEMPKFSEDLIRDGIYEGFTVSYMCIQIAVYMGFTDIYLLGIDHNYSKTVLPDGNIAENVDVVDHFSEKDIIENIPQLYKSTLAYEKSNFYAKEKGIRIYNVTRGGKLEAFPRMNFDSLFE